MSTDAAMIKLLAYVSTRIHRDTMIMLNFDTAAAFDRMYPMYSNMLDAEEKIDQIICECVLETIRKLTSTRRQDWVCQT